MGIRLSFFLADCRVYSEGVNTKYRYCVSCMKKEELICGRKKRLVSIYTDEEISYLYHHNPTYLGLVRSDALTIRLFSQLSCSADPGELFLSPDSRDLLRMHRRLFPPFPLHFAASFFWVILRRAQTVTWSQDWEASSQNAAKHTCCSSCRTLCVLNAGFSFSFKEHYSHAAKLKLELFHLLHHLTSFRFPNESLSYL